MHVLLSLLALEWDAVGFLTKGREVKLIQGGRLLRRNLLLTLTTQRDLHEQVRTTMKTNDLGKVDEAYLERGGDVSFIDR